MKPGKPLERRTPLGRGSGLKRTGGLARGGNLARRAPAKVIKRAARGVDLADGIGERVARHRVKGRSNGWCEMQVAGVCLGRATNWCHRKGQGQGGLWQACNGLAGCGSGTTGCHGWCHSNPAAARERGWMVLRNENPADVPVLLPTGQRVLLDDVGDYLPIAA